jgi:U3 small nucleolar RNA-associated protein 10
LLTTFLPYHTLPVFATLLSILPAKKIPEPYKFLHPYIRSLTPPGRHVIVYSAINNGAFSSYLNAYVLKVTNIRQEYPALLSFWAGVMTEAISGILEKSRSGRKGVQAEKEQDVILRFFPTLNEGLSMKSAPGLRIGCYMILSIIATKGTLDDKLLTAMMEAVVLGWSKDTLLPGLHCLSILAQERGPKQLTRRLTKELLKICDLPSLLVDISKQHRIDKLANGLCLALISRVSKTGNAESLPLVEHAVRENLLSDAQAIVMVKALLLAAHRIDDKIDADGSARSQLARSLTVLVECPGHTGLLVQGVLKDTKTDMDELEMKLKAIIRRKVIPSPELEDVVMEDRNDSCPTTTQSFSTLFTSLLSGSGESSSFLGLHDPEIYGQMCRAFVTSVPSTENLDQFDKSPMLRRDLALDKAIYLSFYIRIWCGPHPVLVRTAALQMVARFLQKPERTILDVQAIIPYAVVALKDPAGKVRCAAAKLVVQLGQLYEIEKDSKRKNFPMRRWGSDDLYGEGEDTNAIKWLPIDYVGRFVHDILIPNLEECVLDKLHLDFALEKALNGYKSSSETAKKDDQRRLSHTLRAAIVLCLASHAIITPMYMAKLQLLTTLNQVRKVGGSTRTSVLLPLLQHWMTLSPIQRHKICQDELIDLEGFENEVIAVIVPNDTSGLECMASITKGEAALDRPTLTTAVFLRIRKMWPSLEGEMRIKTAQLLLDTALWPACEPSPNTPVQSEAMNLLRTLDLSTDVLMSFLHQLPTAAKLADKPPVTKRRRISHSETGRASTQDSKQLAEAIQKVTFVLQLIDGSNPRGHTALLGGLFNALAELQHFKVQVGSELGYLQGLVLSSLLSIVTAYKADRSQKLDRSAVRADLLVDCVQKSASPQVQNAALLLIASLADAAPELVLHSVMPIFTFMGSSVLRQNDEYSAHVIKQTIKEVIPPLIASLRKEKGNPVTGAAELLLSFVAAYEHVPTHRRKGLFTSLVQTLGAKDFLFALLAMLADKYGATSNIIAFAIDLSSGFDVDIQLQSALKIIDLIIDILQPKPTVSSVLLSSRESSTPEPHRIALIQLTQLPHLLSQRQLIEQTGSLLERDDMDASRVRDLYTLLLEKILALAGTLKNTAELHNVCGDVLESILGLLSTNEFVKVVESLLDRPNEELRRKILLSFQARIERENQSDEVSRLAMLNFLPQLTAIIRESQDVLYKHLAVSCVDKIAEKYGKKDLEAVAAAAHTIASGYCLGQGDRKLRVMALLCLASLIDILREGIVSVLPIAIPQTLDYMSESVEGENEDLKLHNAGYSLMSALVHHLSYMVSGPYLERLLSISNKSAEAELDENADESRIQCLQLAAKQIEAKNMFIALEKNWKHATISGISVSSRVYVFISDH